MNIHVGIRPRYDEGGPAVTARNDIQIEIR